MDKLTEKQKKFADEYLIDLNGTQAAIRAGYSENTARQIASENLSKPNIKSYIDQRLQKLEDERIAKADEVLKYLTSAMRGEVVEEVVVTENIGDFMSEARIVKKEIGAKDRIKAAELLGKRHRLFTDKVEVSGEVVVFNNEDKLED